MNSESFRLWLESQQWYEYYGWLLAQPSDPYLSAMFLIGLTLAMGLAIVIFAMFGKEVK